MPYLSRHFRVVVLRRAGQRPLGPAARPGGVRPRPQVGTPSTVLDATGTDRAVVVGLSQGGGWALQLAAEHGDRVLGRSASARPCPSPTATLPASPTARPARNCRPRGCRCVGRDPLEHWAKYDPEYWQDHHEDFLWFFFGMCFPEPHSTKQIEDCVGWGLDTTPDVLAAESRCRPSRETIEEWCRAVASPVLAIHGGRDMISPSSRGQRIAELTAAGASCWRAPATSRWLATRSR